MNFFWTYPMMYKQEIERSGSLFSIMFTQVPPSPVIMWNLHCGQRHSPQLQSNVNRGQCSWWISNSKVEFLFHVAHCFDTRPNWFHSNLRKNKKNKQTLCTHRAKISITQFVIILIFKGCSRYSRKQPWLVMNILRQTSWTKDKIVSSLWINISTWIYLICTVFPTIAQDTFIVYLFPTQRAGDFSARFREGWSMMVLRVQPIVSTELVVIVDKLCSYASVKKTKSIIIFSFKWLFTALFLFLLLIWWKKTSLFSYPHRTVICYEGNSSLLCWSLSFFLKPSR